MALCTRCGQPTRPGVECCMACGGDVAAIGAYSGAASRVLDSPGGRDAARSQLRYAAWAEFRATDPLSHQGPHRSRFRFEQPTGTAAFDQWPSIRPPVDRDRQVRHDRTFSVQSPYRRSTAADPAHSRRSPDPALSPSLRAAATYRPGRSGGSHHRRTGALAATRAILFMAGIVAIVLAVHYGAPSQTAADRSRTAGPEPASATSGSRSPVVNDLVTVEPGATTAPHEAAVVALLNRYFGAINRHAYRAYEKLFSPALRSGLSAATFRLGYGTTTDSAETVRSITVIGPGQIDAIVTFTSHQQPADSPTQSSCTAWRMSLYLLKRGASYVLAASPDGYQPAYRSCS